MIWRIIGVLGIVTSLFSTPTFASCAPRFSFCHQLPKDSEQSVIFLGTVSSVIPISEADAASYNPQRRYPVARFQVTENFKGIESSEIELLLTSDAFMDNIPMGVTAFRAGEQWLVEGYYDPQEKKWMTSNCSRNNRLENAEQELRVLRAWKSGHVLKVRLNGEVINRDERKQIAEAKVTFRNEKRTMEITTDARGQFLMENVEPGVYEVTTEGSPVRTLDLTRGWCSTIVLFVK